MTMKTEIIDEKHNQFMKRKELVITIENPEEATPQKAALQQLIAKEHNMDVESVDIRDIMQEYGVSRAKARVFIWDEKKVADLSKPPAQAAAAPEVKDEKKQ